MEKKLSLSAPWTTFYREMKALFGQDPEISIWFDEEAGDIKLYVDNMAKASALSMLLPVEKSWGNVAVGVSVIPSNKAGDESGRTQYDTAFSGNPAFVRTLVVNPVPGTEATFVVFKREVVQFFNDDLGSPWGLKATLYEDVAKDVFKENPGTFYCTEAGEAWTPFGEWA